MKDSNRIEWIDYTKAFACFLVVLGHLLQSLTTSKLDNNYIINEKINTIIYLFHMPLFMCLSGYLYFLKKYKFTLKEYKKFEINKIINLGIPYFTFYSLFIILNIVASKNVNYSRGFNDLLNIFNNPIAPFWFLYALLAIFIITPIIEKVFKYDKKKVFIIFVLLKMVSLIFKFDIYFIDSFMNWGIYFYLGNYVEEIIKKIKMKNYVIIILYLTFAILYSIYYIKIPNILNEIIKILFAIIGTIITINTFKNIKKSKILDSFKKYTFQIYLMHTIFAAAFRIFLIKINVRDFFVHLIFGILISIYIPVIVSKICEKTKYFNVLFFPIKTIKEIKEIRK